MPEGDTIHRAAATMQQALAGEVVMRFESALAPLAHAAAERPPAGRSIEGVRAVGKNLIIDFSGDLHLRTHMRMHGSWHLYRPGDRWQRPRSDMRIVIQTRAWHAVAFNVPVAELLSGRELERHEELRASGPDLLAADFDPDEAMRRLHALGEMEIADALLNQRAIAGAGNVFKSEALFAAGIHPATRVAGITDSALRELLTTLRKQMLRNARPGRVQRVTTGSLRSTAALWVYGRRGEACRVCGTAIEQTRQGPHARVTFWCPVCQK